MNNSIPFGVLYEEQGSIDIDEKGSYFDEELQITVIPNGKAELVPFVENQGLLGTKTFTRIQKEDTDPDPTEENLLGTRTFTNTKREETDNDPHFVNYLGTLTVTYTKEEATDQDESPDEKVSSPKFTTHTATKSSGEDTNSDE
jgi:hypothetical protein